MAERPEAAQARLFARAAERAAARPAFLSATLLAFAASEGLDDASLAAYLGCQPEQMSALKLCLRPRHGPSFREDVEHIASRFGLDSARLAHAIRLVDAIAALRQADEPTGGLLAAARDRVEPPAEETT
jgi:hypothetical protein